MVAKGRERKLSMLCSKDALFMIPTEDGSASRGSWQVHEEGSCQEQVRGGRGGKRCEARRTRWNARLKGLRVIVSLFLVGMRLREGKPIM